MELEPLLEEPWESGGGGTLEGRTRDVFGKSDDSVSGNRGARSRNRICKFVSVPSDVKVGLVVGADM